MKLMAAICSDGLRPEGLRTVNRTEKRREGELLHGLYDALCIPVQAHQ